MERTYFTDKSSSGLIQYNNGKYCWVYELPMFKSFFLLFDVWQVMICAALIVYIILVIINIMEGGGINGVITSLETCALVAGILLVLSLPAYYIVTKANNGKYTVLFEMDDSGIDHIQIKTEKARALEALSVLVGIKGSNPSAAASGILAATGGSLYSRYGNVRRIRAVREKNLIILQGRFLRNEVYVGNEDYDFVYEYLVSHCSEASKG